eukprot:4573301-Pyramimonas_sp.AAC.1
MDASASASFASLYARAPARWDSICKMLVRLTREASHLRSAADGQSLALSAHRASAMEKASSRARFAPCPEDGVTAWRASPLSVTGPDQVASKVGRRSYRREA